MVDGIACAVPTRSELERGKRHLARSELPHEPRLGRSHRLDNRSGGQRPEVKRVRVLGNQRLTTGGTVKKSKPKQKSVKKSRTD